MVKRFFLVHDVPSREVRGQHAHRVCHQFLVCVSGSCRVIADDGKRRQEFLLDRNSLGLYLPPMVWAAQFDYSADAALARAGIARVRFRATTSATTTSFCAPLASELDVTAA